jgi:acetyltransferase-like isoleucine patch superfamily enzyme
VIYASDGKKPNVHETAYVAPTAVLSGDVTIGAGCAVLHGAVIVSEGAPIEIDESCVIMEHAVLRAHGKAVKIARRSIVSPSAYIVDASLAEDAHVPAGATLGENARSRNPESYAKFLRDLHSGDIAAGETPRPKRASMPPPPPAAEVEGVDSAMMQELAELEHRRQEALRKQREHK